MKTACGASLIATQFTDIVEYSSGATAARLREPEKTANHHSATSTRTSAPATGVVKQEKSIKRIFWTYGPNELPLDEASRHYVDLNLHLITENYAPGETALIVIKNDDDSDLISDTRTMQLQAVVGLDGSAKLMNVFKNKTVEIGVIS